MGYIQAPAQGIFGHWFLYLRGHYVPQVNGPKTIEVLHRKLMNKAPYKNNFLMKQHLLHKFQFRQYYLGSLSLSLFLNICSSFFVIFGILGREWTLPPAGGLFFVELPEVEVDFDLDLSGYMDFINEDL